MAVAVLAVLQWRWTGRWGAVEEARLQSLLRVGAAEVEPELLDDGAEVEAESVVAGAVCVVQVLETHGGLLAGVDEADIGRRR